MPTSKPYAVLLWRAGDGYFRIESFHSTHQRAELRSAMLYREQRSLRPKYPYPRFAEDVFFIPVHLEDFRRGIHGGELPQ